MLTPLDLNTLRLQRDQLQAQLAQIGDMRPGSLVPRFRKCGKPACHCAKKGSMGHGPSYSLTHPISGKTVTRIIPAGAAVDRTRAQLEEYHRFRRLVQQFTTVSEQVCDLQLRQSELDDTKKKSTLDGLLAAEILWDIEALVGRQSLAELDLEALESAVRRQALRLAGRAIEQRLNADHSDAGQSHIRCPCGQSARYAGRREKLFTSVLGPLKLERAYFPCSGCGHGFCPRDQQLGLDNTALSPAVTRMIGTVGAMVSFEEGSQLLAELAGLAIDAKQVERTAEALGAAIAADEKRNATPADDLPLPPTLYLGLDGTGIPVRAFELKDRTGKQPDGSAKTREVKLCTVWSAEGRDENGIPVRDQGSISYSAAIETAATLDTAKQM